MKLENTLRWWQSNALTKKRYDALLQVYGDLDSALDEISPSMLKELGLRDETIARTLDRLRDFNVTRYLKEMERHEVQLLSIEDERYPASLRNIEDAPVFLSYRGNISLVHQPLISIVGTRAMSPDGKRVVEKFVPAFVRAHMTTVSGLALGVDAAVAGETIRAGGKTIAVLGHGLASIYPTVHESLAEKILDKGGLLLSEFPLEMKPDTYTFPARNRIIAGLSDGTLVCEAPDGSGSVITAELALEYNREVLAVPGQIFDQQYEGCHRLIAQGQAQLVTTPEEILRVLGVISSPADHHASQAYSPHLATEAAVYGALTSMPQTIDQLVERTGLSAADVSVALTLIEMAAAARTIGGGQWVLY